MPSASTPSAAPALSVDRFATPRRTVLVDWLMNQVITVGGISVIAAVLLICVFILLQVIPLFRGASVTVDDTRNVAFQLAAEPLAMGMDEWGGMPFVLTADGRIAWLPAAGEAQPTTLVDGRLVSGRWDPVGQRLIAGTSDGRLVTAPVTFTRVVENGDQRITPVVAAPVAITLAAGVPLAMVASSGPEGISAAVTGEAVPRLLVQVGAGPVQDLTTQLASTPVQVLVDERGDSAVAISQSGEVAWLAREGDALIRRQVFTPFADVAGASTEASSWAISQAFFLLGDVSLVFVNPAGQCRQFSLFIRPGESQRTWGLTKSHPDLPAGAGRAFAISQRNKAFLVSAGNDLSLRYGTSASERWSGSLPAATDLVALNAKYNRFAALGRDGSLRTFALSDPHPESGLAAFFAPVWYEGYSEPRYEWQSSGASDDFEPKLSMVTLVWGTLKATAYTMLFALPVALLAAIYTAEFMHARFKAIVKPAVEVMASLPSVVLGFLAALWLAPLIEHRVPSVLSVMVIVPALAMTFGWWWSRQPPSFRSRLPQGYEFLVLIPFLVAAGWAAWQIGIVLDPLLFHYTTAASAMGGEARTVTGFAEWWRHTTGLAYEQRNSLVVGVMMGFAVIPIIFTIAEDALSNVPAALRSGSLACGASRWQTAIRVVVPTASAGIFSALMIGLGRAIGETMIVVMATGNTGIIDPNIFNGMRTLSANIAVELPEAPHGGTLFRALFLGAMLLFIFTFVINTVAEVMRQRLREKYKTV